MKAGVASLILGLGAVSCVEPRAAARVVDSSGVRVIESAISTWSESNAWRVDTTPFLDIGDDQRGPAYELVRVTGAMRTADGGVIVANSGSAEVRRYAASGDWVWSTGRRGDGPGEFNRLSQLARAANDSVVAFDFWLGRATMLDAQGNLGRTVTPYRPGTRVRQLWPLHDRGFLAMVIDFEAVASQAGRVRYPAHLVRTGADGVVLDTVVTVPSEESFIIPTGDARPLFARNAYVAVRDSLLLVGNGDTMEYREYTTAGRLVGIVRGAPSDLTVSAEDVARERRSYAIPNAPDWHRALVASLPAPATRPAFAALVVDATGAVWLGPYRSQGVTAGPAEWAVFDRAGTWLGHVSLPGDLRVFEIGQDYVLGTQRDSLDVEHVQVRRLRR
jgi:hypothetical protein